MIGRLSVHDVARCLGVDYADADSEIRSVSTDSRTIETGDLFIALVGEQHDGHKYIEKAFDQGAVAAVSQLRSNSESRVLQVASSLDAYGAIAAIQRKRFTGRVIGLTGSSGKTTTRTMLSSMLGLDGKVHSNHANENNEIGVSRCLLQLVGDEDYAVVEMGARKAGDIAWLSKVVQPNLGMILNISEAHLATFGDLKAVARAKGELFDSLGSDALAVANGDDELVRWLVTRSGVNARFFSIEDDSCHCFASGIELGSETTCFCLHLKYDGNDHSAPVTMQVAGKHSISNACAAALCAALAGCSFENIIAGLESFAPVKGRLNAVRLNACTTLVNDCYNANPASLRVAIDTMVLEQGRVNLLVLGDMLELGDQSENLHQSSGRYAAEQGIEMMFTYGEQAQLAADAFCKVRPGMAFAFDSHHMLANKLGETLSMYDLPNQVLVKGSRSMAMEKVIDYLRSSD